MEFAWVDLHCGMPAQVTWYLESCFCPTVHKHWGPLSLYATTSRFSLCVASLFTIYWLIWAMCQAFGVLSPLLALYTFHSPRSFKLTTLVDLLSCTNIMLFLCTLSSLTKAHQNWLELSPQFCHRFPSPLSENVVPRPLLTKCTNHTKRCHAIKWDTQMMLRT